MTTQYNFSAGPAMLPSAVISQAKEALHNWRGMGVSVVELGHRTPVIVDMLNETRQKLSNLLSLPSHYKTLFLGQSARTQFGLIPQNFNTASSQGAYIVSGYWSDMAMKEAKRISQAYSYNPFKNHSNFLSGFEEIKSDTSYVYFTPNETIDGIRLERTSFSVEKPVVADMTSCLLTEPLDINQYAMLFAGAQKNISIAGLTILIIDESKILDDKPHALPLMSDYSFQMKHQGWYATPPVFACLIANLMFDWIVEQGGVDNLHHQNMIKSRLLYDFIDQSGFYTCSVNRAYRSKVNICFALRKKNLEKQFLIESEKNGFLGLNGHKAKGGLRASIYNAMPEEGVHKLIDFMNNFSKEHR